MAESERLPQVKEPILTETELDTVLIEIRGATQTIRFSLTKAMAAKLAMDLRDLADVSQVTSNIDVHAR